MKKHRKTAIVVGGLFIIATAFLFLGESVYAHVLTTPDYLETAYPALARKPAKLDGKLSRSLL